MNIEKRKVLRKDAVKLVETPGRETPDEKTSEGKPSAEGLEILKPIKNLLDLLKNLEL